MKLPRTFVLSSVVAVAALALLAAGCGGSTPSAGVASVPSTTTSSSTAAASQTGLLAFSQCMRSHGVPSFPDPQHFAGGSLKLTIHQLGAGGQAAAMGACNHLLPPNSGPGPSEAQTRTQLADQLSFARCMRRHGVSRFPDPTAQAQLSVAMVEAQGVDVHSPQVLRVVQTCLPASHGGLTAAKVRESLENNPGP